MGTVNLYSGDIPRVSSVLLTHLVKIARQLCSTPRGHAERNLRGKKPVGLWIDHRKAVVITVTEEEEEEELELIISKVEKQLRRSGDSPLQGPYDPLQVYRQLTAARKRLRDISTFTTMR
jgi:hypothetical protein